MKNKKVFKKTDHYRRNDDEIRIKERRKQKNKKFNKQDIFALRAEAEDLYSNPYNYLAQ